jgi:hypothetical protein
LKLFTKDVLQAALNEEMTEHALIFSDDAVGLESRLHEALADRKVNLVRPLDAPVPGTGPPARPTAGSDPWPPRSPGRARRIR